VFKIDGYSGNQHIWNYGEGASTNNDNIHLRLSSNRELYFGWGREGTGYNECKIHYRGLLTTSWYSCYIAFTGEALAGNDASASNLADCFDIRLRAESDGNVGAGNFTGNASNRSISNSSSYGWGATTASTGYRMDRVFDGNSKLTLGGRSSNRNFHGQIASFVCTTLERDTPMPDAAEIAYMMTDPIGWFYTYKNGNSGRLPNQQFTTFNYALNDADSSKSTQIWLMGDLPQDSYINGIKNYVNPSSVDTKLNFNSMVSNDIINVNISGLS